MRHNESLTNTAEWLFFFSYLILLRLSELLVWDQVSICLADITHPSNPVSLSLSIDHFVLRMHYWHKVQMTLLDCGKEYGVQFLTMTNQVQMP